ncbi:MAG TPA: hypothetical protein VGM59_13890 [Dongiaceae bacterium]|jgi:hypothetical protein
MENGFSVFHALILLVLVFVLLIPYVKIIKKAGYSSWWVLTLFIPLVNFIMLWVFAFARWPLEDRADGRGMEKVF